MEKQNEEFIDYLANKLLQENAELQLKVAQLEYMLKQTTQQENAEKVTDTDENSNK